MTGVGCGARMDDSSEYLILEPTDRQLRICPDVGGYFLPLIRRQTPSISIQRHHEMSGGRGDLLPFDRLLFAVTTFACIQIVSLELLSLYIGIEHALNRRAFISVSLFLSLFSHPILGGNGKCKAMHCLRSSALSLAATALHNLYCQSSEQQA